MYEYKAAYFDTVSVKSSFGTSFRSILFKQFKFHSIFFETIFPFFLTFKMKMAPSNDEFGWASGCLWSFLCTKRWNQVRSNLQLNKVCSGNPEIKININRNFNCHPNRQPTSSNQMETENRTKSRKTIHCQIGVCCSTNCSHFHDLLLLLHERRRSSSSKETHFFRFLKSKKKLRNKILLFKKNAPEKSLLFKLNSIYLNESKCTWRK